MTQYKTLTKDIHVKYLFQSNPCSYVKRELYMKRINDYVIIACSKFSVGK